MHDHCRGLSPFPGAWFELELAGKPVRVILTRDQEHGWDFYGPATLVDIRAGVDSSGTITAFEVLQSAPEDYPTLRPHRAAVGLYDFDADGRLVRVHRGPGQTMGVAEGLVAAGAVAVATAGTVLEAAADAFDVVVVAFLGEADLRLEA